MVQATVQPTSPPTGSGTRRILFPSFGGESDTTVIDCRGAKRVYWMVAVKNAGAPAAAHSIEALVADIETGVTVANAILQVPNITYFPLVITITTGAVSQVGELRNPPAKIMLQTTAVDALLDIDLAVELHY